MTISWATLFDDFATKTVTSTDKGKAAYVLTADQCRVIKSAGIAPSPDTMRPAAAFPVTVLGDTIKSVSTSYYHSIREADRPPEPRLGRALISSWLENGDTLLLGVIDQELFALKVSKALSSEEVLQNDLISRARAKTILARAAQAKGKPSTKMVNREEFVRNPYVIKATLLRAGGKCEMPGCTNALFFRDTDDAYLEVHHVQTLAKGGDDAMTNTAALCPHCHRNLHFGRTRKKQRSALQAYMSTLR